MFIQLPPQATWQDLKDLFREAGSIIRADVQFYPDGTPKGNGIVVYENPEDAKNAIRERLTSGQVNSLLTMLAQRCSMATSGVRPPFKSGR